MLFIVAAVSGSTDVTEDLLSRFVDIGNKECFAPLLYVCFDLLRLDVVEELSLQHGHNNIYIPYNIQVSRTTRKQLAALEKEVKERSQKESVREQQEAEVPIINAATHLMITNGSTRRTKNSSYMLSDALVLRYVGQPPPVPLTNGHGMVGMMLVSATKSAEVCIADFRGLRR